MTEAMKRFLELNELMEREMQAQRQEAKAAENELVAQTYPMRERIDKDLLELDKLGVGEIETDVKLDVLFSLYEYWPEIMASAEEKIMKKIVVEREAECARLEHKIKTWDELLAKIKSVLEDK